MGCGPPAQDGRCTKNSELEAWRGEGMNYKRTVQKGGGTGPSSRERTPLVVSRQRLEEMLSEVNEDGNPKYIIPDGSYAEFPSNSGKYLLCPDVGSKNNNDDYQYISVTKVPGNCDGALVPACGKTDNKDKLSEGFNLYGANLRKKNLRTKTYYKSDHLRLKEGKTLEELVDGFQIFGFVLIGYHVTYDKERKRFVWRLYRKDGSKELSFLLDPEKITPIREPTGAFRIEFNTGRQKKGKKKSRSKRTTFTIIFHVGLDSFNSERKSEGKKNKIDIFTDDIKAELKKYVVKVNLLKPNIEGLKSNSELTSSKLALPGIVGKLPLNLKAILRFLTIKCKTDTTEWRRIGVGDYHDVSIINCLNLAETENVAAYKTSRGARETLYDKCVDIGLDNCLGLVAVSAGISTVSALKEYINNPRQVFNVRELHPLLEYLWEFNIIITGRYWTESDKAQFKLPYHKNFYYPYKNYGRTIIVYEHCGRPDSCCEYVCELVQFQYGGKRSFVLGNECFQEELRNIWIRSEKSFARTGGDNFKPLRPVKIGDIESENWKVLLGDGELIGLQYDNVDFFPHDFMTPLPFPIGKPSAIQSAKDIERVVRATGGEKLRENEHKIDCKILDIRLEAPVRKVSDTRYKLRVNHRIASVLLGYAMFQYSSASEDLTRDERLDLFIRIEGGPSDTDIYTSKLPPPPEALHEKIVIYEDFGNYDEIVEKLTERIVYYEKKFPLYIQDFSQLRVIPWYYSSVESFSQSSGVIITEWMKLFPLFNGKLYTFPLFNIGTGHGEQTYYLRNPLLTQNEVCLARTFSLRDFSLDNLKTWLDVTGEDLKIVRDIWANFRQHKTLANLLQNDEDIKQELQDKEKRRVAFLSVPTVRDFVSPNNYMNGLNLVKYPDNNRMVAFICDKIEVESEEEESSGEEDSGNESDMESKTEDEFGNPTQREDMNQDTIFGSRTWK
jgi:hypothetical protein